ncbi:MAG TPA: CCA tRNA nucleotidyltransferase [Verrucomicrobiae bacterium]|nr:CCA tRNA nucleotidyltransferase [Verrucomicrobiae bacterium]
MRSEHRLDPQPWMTAPDTVAVLKALTAGGQEARFVGGCVRDALLKRSITDIDIATPEPPEQVMKLLKAAGITVVPTGLKHGTITAVLHKRPYEITTLRRDVETFGRHARVEYTDSWEADASRRDFTMNALFCSPDGTLFDAFDGIKDLREKRVRFVGEAEARIREDVLRLLRYFRFYAHYGTPPPDPAALKACRDLAHLLPTLSGERVCQETLKLLRAREPASVFRLMGDQEILPQFLPEATQIDRLAALVAIEGIVSTPLVEPGDAIRRLAALLGDGIETAAAVASRLRFSNSDRERLRSIVSQNEGGIDPDLNPVARRRLIYRLGTDCFIDRALLAWAGIIAQGGPQEHRVTESWIELIRFAREWTVPVFPLKGRDVIDAGMTGGPEIGEVMEQIHAWWVAGDFAADRTVCLDKLRAIVDTRAP